MNELLIPPPLNWYLCNSFDCASDNTVVYCSRKDIIIINPTSLSEPADIQQITDAHSEKTLGVAFNHCNWGDPDKLIVSIGADKVVRLWDKTTKCLKMHHKQHMNYDDTLVGVSLVNDRVVSVSDKGVVIVWRISSNNITKIEDMFHTKSKVVCLSSCPHAPWLTAFGFRGGLIIIADLRKEGKIVHRMKGNDQDVTSLSWCPTPINIYKTKTGLQIANALKQSVVHKNKNKKSKEAESAVCSSNKNKEGESTVCKSNKSEEGESIAHKSNENEEVDTDTDTESVDNTDETSFKELQEKINDLSIVDDVLGVDTPKYNMSDRKTLSYKKVNKTNPWGNVEFNDSDEENKPDSSKENASDFLQECNSLLNIIKKQDVPEKQKDDAPEIPHVFTHRKFIKAMRNKKSEKNCKESTNVSKNEERQEVENILNDETDKDNCKVACNKSINNQDSIKSSEDEVINFEICEEETASEPTRFISHESIKEYLLASAGNDGDVHIWRGLTDGRLQQVLPNAMKKKKGRNNYRDFSKHRWIAVCWAKPDILLVSSLSNRVYCWNLFITCDINKLSSKTIHDARLVHQDHNSTIFNICVPHKVYPTFIRTSSLDNLDDFFIWTTSKDKVILCTTIGMKRRTISSYPCPSSSVNCIVSSPIDPSKLAIGLYDCTVRIWDLSVPHIKIITMVRLFEHSQDKITCLDWHPVKENYLAYSTADGKIGRVLTHNKTQVFFHPHHKNSVHKIQWAPTFDKENEYVLYSCSFGDLIHHNETDPTLEPTKVNLNDGRAHTFAWSSDFSILAVGTKEGSVKLLSKNLTVYETLYMQKKSVQCLSWHPECTVADSGVSQYKNYLAVSTNEPQVYIYNCRTSAEIESGENSSLVAVLEGHNNSVKWLSWCPQVSGRLATGAENNVIMVWNVINQTLLSTFHWGGKDILGYLLWSPLDADLIILGGRNQTIKIFRITKHPPVIIEKKTDVEKKGDKKKSTKINTSDNDNESVSSSVPEKPKKIFILSAMARLQNPDHADNMAILRKLMEIVNNRTEDTEEQELSDDDTTDTEVRKDFKIDIIQLFGSRKDMVEVLNYEQQQHFAKSHMDSLHHISMWKGDLAESIEKALKCGIVNPWIINMAPMVSHTAWTKLCMMYADQLTEEGRGLEASSYYLACHQVHKAVHALCCSNLYREALALAKIRLTLDDPIICDICEQWATYCNINGNYEIAAQCYVALGKFSDAAMLLNKRIEPEKLELALELATHGKNHDLQVAILAKLELLNQQKEQVCGDQSDTQVPKLPSLPSSRLQALLTSIKENKMAVVNEPNIETQNDTSKDSEKNESEENNDGSVILHSSDELD